MTLRPANRLASLSCLSLLLAACDSTVTSGPSNGDGAFESDAPSNTSNGRYLSESAASDAAAGGSSASSTGAQSNNVATDAGDAARAIEEADIIKVEGTRLYALSQYGGLSVIDIGARDHMRLLGRKKVQAQPFEMYVRDQKVFALYNGYGEYVKGAKEGEWNWVTTSYVVAFDTTDPTEPSTIGRFSIPGTIQDSRIVGNAMYVVGYESNGCWGCAAGEHTTVISLDVSTPSAIRKVDERAFADDSTTTYSWKRSISVTDKRMYIAGPEYGTSGTVGSKIQVVDISDPNGKLVDGAEVSASGRIDSRWQMDELNGILRVISQPGDWRPSDPPRIQTFRIDSSQSLTQLAAVAMVVPANESLRSVRFDGTRGYAITAVQTDPLYTIDLSDPALPRQVGELEMPGWIYHMEPRGDRVVALGYDQGNSAGALTVSLFDVGDMAKPMMLDRVNFGGDWSWIVEDQDRVHKAFQVLDASNLVLMPFSGYSNDGNCYSKWVSGVQLVDWAGDHLTLQGVAPTVGQARRGFLHDSRLFTVSDERVETFDIASRAQPKITDSLKLTQKVSRTLDAGTAVVKIGQDWYSESVSIDTTTLAEVEDPASSGHIDVKIGTFSCNSSSYLGQVVAKDGKVYLLVDEYSWNSGDGKSSYTTKLVTVDVTQPNQPKLVGEASLDYGQGWQYWYNSGLVDAGAAAVIAGDAIVTMGREDIYDSNSDGSQEWLGTRSKLYVIDPKNPNKPGVSVVQLPESLGTTGLLPSGTTVGIGHYVKSPTDPQRVRFYMDRLNVADPGRPTLVPGVNVPGSPVAFDAESSNVLTVDYQNIIRTGVTSDWCQTNYKNAWFEYTEADSNAIARGDCHSVQQTLNLVGLQASQANVIGSKTLEIGDSVTNFAVGVDRVFMTVGASYGGYNGRALVADCMNCGGFYGYYAVQATELPLLVVGGLNSGKFVAGRITLDGGDSWGYAPMVASGKRVLLSTGWQGKLAVVDGSDVAHPKLVRDADVFGNAQSLTAIDGIGIASLYYDGVQTIRIDDPTSL